ncbi:DUF3245 domain-containing protein [Aspergillus undulatus]|uniref:DUF3245 domain-containing protein n=1 Tax=Aspergillus undulatus TaxID=1810928 RepID=UPI003CCE2F84
MSLSKSETDIILNKANIALARSQRLVASWLPAEPTTDEKETKPDAQLQREDDDIFTAVPETLGLGAPLPSKAADGSWNRTELDSNDALRRQLLGRNYKKVMAEKEKARQQKIAENGSSGSSMKSSGKGAGAGNHQRSSGGGGRGVDDDEDDDDEGRAASIGKKASSRKKKVEGNIETTPAAQTETNNGELRDEDNEAGEGSKTATSQQRPKPKGRKKATSFLDEVLAERSKKRKKR